MELGHGSSTMFAEDRDRTLPGARSVKRVRAPKAPQRTRTGRSTRCFLDAHEERPAISHPINGYTGIMSVGSAKPLVATTGWAMGSYVAAVGLQLRATGNMEVSLRALVVCLAGALYTNLFEHIWHRYAMHGRRPDPRHATHHRLFYGERFHTSDPAALEEIVTGWFIFPLLLTVHYAAFILLFGSGLTDGLFV